MLSTLNILDEKLIAFASRRFPGCRGVAHVSPSTLWRWAMKGCRAKGGHLVKLRVIRAGSRWFTTENAVREFCEALSDIPDAEPAPRSPSATRRASEAAGRQLEAMGV